jgi:hypothetical protein
MKAKPSESISEALRVLQQVGEMPPSLSPADSVFTGIDDLGELFLAELRSRRERLAKWVALLQAEAGREVAPVRVERPTRHQCRGRATHRGDRLTIGHLARRMR